MKRTDLENKLKKKGWKYLRSGGNHDIWTNGKDIEAIPRHKEINENLAKAIIKRWEL